MAANGASLGVASLAGTSGLQPDAQVEQRKVVVLGVPWQTEDATLERHFSQFGVIEEAQIMRERYTGKSRGFGFVTFATATDAHRAVASEHTIDGRRCEAKFALPEGKVGSARTTRIFVARIPSSITDAQFRGYFEQFGAVQDAYMPKDPSKHAHRGIGFVTYATPDSVERVMAQTHVLNGNEIAIDRATPKERGASLPGRLSMSQPNLHMMAPGGSAHGGNAFGFLRGGPPPSPARHGDMYGSAGLGSRRMSQPALNSTQGQFGSPGGGRPGTGPVVMNGMPPPGGMYSGPPGPNMNLLAQAQAQVQAAALQHQLSSGSLTGLEAAGQASPQQLINLINANVAAASGTMPPGPYPVPGSPHPGPLPHSGSVNQLPGSGASSSNDLSGLLGPGPDQMGGMMPPPWAAMGPRGMPGAVPALGPASARAGPRIFVGKLNRETGEHDVKEYFSRFGYVLDVYLPRDKTNKREHRGFGFVTFETEASIHRVVTHGTHHIRGTVVAIDAAVPRQEELLPPGDPGMQGAVAPPPAAAAAADPESIPQAFEGLTLEAGAQAGGGAAPGGPPQGLSY